MRSSLGEKYRGGKCSSYFYTVINISFTKADTIFKRASFQHEMALRSLSHDFSLIPFKMYLKCHKQLLLRRELSLEFEAILRFNDDIK